jgi:uncharacterized membrane protein (Fun14 family)
MKHVIHTWETIREHFSEYPTWVPEVGLAAFLGLVLGFLVRVVGRYLLVALLVLGVTGVVLHYTSVVTFHTETVEALLGFSRVPTLQETGQFMWDHLAATLTAVVAFMLGWRLGR